MFVGEARFGGPVRPGALMVNNAAAFKATAAIGGMKRESHNLGGPSAQRVMVNRGPNPDQVQKVSGKRFAPVPIREAALRTSGPMKNNPVSAKSAPAKSGGAVDKGPDHGADHPEAPKQREERSTSSRDSWSGRDAGPSDSRGGGRSMGGGRGRH